MGCFPLLVSGEDVLGGDLLTKNGVTSYRESDMPKMCLRADPCFASSRAVLTCEGSFNFEDYPVLSRGTFLKSVNC